MNEGGGFPRIRPVGDIGVMVEFADALDGQAHAAVLGLDAALKARPFPGFTEAVPAYASLFVGYDPLAAEPAGVRAHLQDLLAAAQPAVPAGRLHEIPVCYDPPFGPDLAAVAERTGLRPESVIEAHLSGTYGVFMYGFAPGYAYMSGVPEPIQVPRKPAPVRGIPAGSVIIAGPQCLVTTIVMPTGWWIIGRSPARILRPESAPAFLFEVGDRVVFRRIDVEALLAAGDDGA